MSEITSEGEMRRPLLSVDHLTVDFRTRTDSIRAIDKVSFTVDVGEMVGVVGESGSGKSVSMLAVLGLLPRRGPVIGGSAEFEGQNLLSLNEAAMRKIRGRRIGLIPPDAAAALNPVTRIGEQLLEGLAAHRPNLSKPERIELAISTLEDCGLQDAAGLLRRFPHELSGGMQQRVIIASAMMLQPRLLIADEPTTALDVTVQERILALLAKIRAERQTSIVLITHDMTVVAGNCDRVVVMYAGQVVEVAGRDTIFTRPGHPYTRALIASVPPIDVRAERLKAIPGAMPHAGLISPGCRFADRCPLRAQLGSPEICTTSSPPLTELAPGHTAACHFAESDVNTKVDAHA